MYEYIDDMEQAIDDPDGFFRANWSLHRKLAAIVPNVVLQTVYLTLLELAEEHIATVSSDPTFSRTSPANVAAHRELVAAIASKDAQRIRLAVDRHEPLAGRRDVPSAHADGPNKLAV
jgi:DNA-binding FadR family transcriptional regulator